MPTTTLQPTATIVSTILEPALARDPATTRKNKISTLNSSPTTSTSIRTPIPSHHQQWWDEFQQDHSSRGGTDVNPAQQQCWEEFKHGMQVHNTRHLEPANNPYGFTSAGTTPDIISMAEIRGWEDSKVKVNVRGGVGDSEVRRESSSTVTGRTSSEDLVGKGGDTM